MDIALTTAAFAANPGAIKHKVANALIADVRPAPWIAALLKMATLGRTPEASGGLWVGGEIDLFEDRIRFSPNALNTAVQTGNLSREVLLTAVTDVAWRLGILTGIIEISHDGGRFTFRCYGAKAFASRIKAAAAARRG